MTSVGPEDELQGPGRGTRVDQQIRLRAGRDARSPRAAHLQSQRRRCRRPRRRTRTPRPACTRQRRQGDPGTSTSSRRTRPRPSGRRPAGRPDPARPTRHSYGPALRHPPPAQPRPNRDRSAPQTASAPAPAHLRYYHARRWRRSPRQGGDSYLVSRFMEAFHRRCAERDLPPLDALVVHVAGTRKGSPAAATSGSTTCSTPLPSGPCRSTSSRPHASGKTRYAPAKLGAPNGAVAAPDPRRTRPPLRLHSRALMRAHAECGHVTVLPTRCQLRALSAISRTLPRTSPCRPSPSRHLCLAGSRNQVFRIVVCHDPTRRFSCSMALSRMLLPRRLRWAGSYELHRFKRGECGL
jgi:hypothetical protein